MKKTGANRRHRRSRYPNDRILGVLVGARDEVVGILDLETLSKHGRKGVGLVRNVDVDHFFSRLYLTASVGSAISLDGHMLQ